MTTENNGPARLFRNDTVSGNRWVRLVLVGAGAGLNRDAAEAEVTVEAGGLVRRFYATGARGYLSQSETAVTVGLGGAEAADQVSVAWPTADRREQEWAGLRAGMAYRLTAGRAGAEQVPAGR